MKLPKLPLVAIVVIGVFILSRDTRNLNVRNNNPLNIRFNSANNWVGQVGEHRGFVVFDTVEHGFRAAKRIFQTYKKRGVVTLEQIIHEWAPPIENDTDAYVDFVSGETGIQANDVVTEDEAPSLLIAMSVFEGSQRAFNIEQAQRGAALA